MSVRTIFLTGRLATLCVDDELVLRQELITDLYGSVKIAPRIVTKVDDEIVESLLRKRGQCYQQLAIGGFAKVLDADVARMVVNHIGRRDAALGYLATGDRELLYALLSVSHHPDLDLRVSGPFQSAHGFLIGNLLTNEGAVVNGHNLVTCQQASPFGRAVLDDALHVDGVFANDKLDAHT